jgi:3-polyprenyl-4-hydroxybenzoate decarboxylase
VEWTGIGVLSIKKTSAGDGLKAGRTVANLVPITKVAIVVDDDVDVLNRTEVMQAVGARWQPFPAAEIIKEARGMALDPSSPKRPMSSKIVIDATRQLPDEGGPRVYPQRNRDLLASLAPESFASIDANWSRLTSGFKRNA